MKTCDERFIGEVGTGDFNKFGWGGGDGRRILVMADDFEMRGMIPLYGL